MKTLKVVVFKMPILFPATLIGSLLWKIGMVINDSKPPIRVIRWSYHKRPNLGWWKRVKEGYFPCSIGYVTGNPDPERVLTEWTISDELYNEILIWFNENYPINNEISTSKE